MEQEENSTRHKPLPVWRW